MIFLCEERRRIPLREKAVLSFFLCRRHSVFITFLILSCLWLRWKGDTGQGPFVSFLILRDRELGQGMSDSAQNTKRP